ncbi:hypothetical protein NDU88_009337 [Pleurodeles waltl]|uniref:Uncharacterized protein n=1 Tax=Pleurodeles waltl TaxID=8319 RepID=A0AAV7P1W1_PLEWA|nr:hypothetical protein NDU88_009337 [Pleurodeles waltl]
MKPLHDRLDHQREEEFDKRATLPSVMRHPEEVRAIFHTLSAVMSVFLDTEEQAGKDNRFAALTVSPVLRGRYLSLVSFSALNYFKKAIQTYACL